MKQMIRANMLFILSIILVAIIFVLDWLTPLGLAAWLGYLAPVSIAAWSTRRRYAYPLTAVCTVLIAMDFAVSPRTQGVEIELVNRIAAVVVLWLVVIINGQLRRAREALTQAQSRLEL